MKVIFYLIFFRPAAHASSFLTLSFFIYSPSPSAGAVDKIVLPEGMQSVNFGGCFHLTGAVDKIVFPVGMQSVNFEWCEGLAGTAKS